MSLRRKTILVFTAIFIGLLVLLNLVSWIFILGGYENAEREDVRDNASGALDTFADNLDDIDTSLKDWACWDATYEFIATSDQAYVESNLADWTLENLRLNVIVYVNLSGEIVYGTGFDLQDNVKTSLSSSLREHLSVDGSILRTAPAGSGAKGVVLLPEGPLLVAFKPILTSLAEGPPRGTLIMGRYLDNGEIEHLAHLGHQDMDITRLDDDNLTADGDEAKTLLLGGEQTVVRALDSQFVAGYALIEDIYGNPALIMKVTCHRDIYSKGVTSLAYFTIFLFAACIAFGIASGLLLEKLVLSRLTRLNENISEIGKKGDFGARVTVEGNDELSSLALSINMMMDELEHSEEHFRTLLENAQDIITVLDREGNIIFDSPSIGRILGYNTDEYLKKSVFEFIHPEDMARAREAFDAGTLAPGAVAKMDVRFAHKDGSWRDIELIGYNLVDDPVIRGMVINARDMTERKLSGERLEKINRLFLSLGADLIENMEKIIEACRDILDVPFATYGRMEKGRLSILSTAPGEESFKVAGKPSDYICHEIISNNWREPMVIEDFESSEYRDSCIIAKQHGFRFFVGYPVFQKRKTIGCLSIFHTEKKELSRGDMEILGMLARALSVEEERLAHEQGLKDFIDVASHELRHPITFMKGYALTLRDYGDRMSDEVKQDYLTIIGQGADRLDMLIKELLDVSRIERGRFSLDRRPVRLEALIERAAGEMKGKGVSDRLSVFIPRKLAPRPLDPEKLLRVLVILLDNAVIHSPEDSEVELVAEDHGTEVIVSVLDHGTGVPEKDRERIFERFYQVEDALHHSAPGMGLGLYIAKEIVEAHEGRLWYEPREGGGSVFNFTLP